MRLRDAAAIIMGLGITFGIHSTLLLMTSTKARRSTSSLGLRPAEVTT